MTARFVLSASPDQVATHFGVSIPHPFPPRYNIAPSQPVGVIRGGADFALMRWGFVPGWDTQGTFFKRPLVNIRRESAPFKNSFRHAWRRRRCLFPINGFYAWTGRGEGRCPWLLGQGEESPLFAVAGLWEHWQGADGSEMETAAMLTRPTQYPLTQFADRMPVMVAPDDYDAWLHTDERDEAPIKAIVDRPQPTMEWWRVEMSVNDWRTDHPGLIRREP